MRRECLEHFSRHWLQRKPLVSDRGMHHDTCVSQVSWCMSGSLNLGCGKNVPRPSRRMHNPQFYVSGKRLIACILIAINDPKLSMPVWLDISSRQKLIINVELASCCRNWNFMQETHAYSLSNSILLVNDSCSSIVSGDQENYAIMGLCTSEGKMKIYIDRNHESIMGH